MTQSLTYQYPDAIDTMGIYRHPTKNGDILFHCFVFPSYTPGPRDAPVYLSELLRDVDKLDETLVRSGLAVAIFFGQRGVDIFSFEPRPDENGNEWLGNGSSISATYLDGKPAETEENGIRVNSCDAGQDIATRILGFRRTRLDGETYERLVFGKEYPSLSPMVDMNKFEVVNFNELESS